MRLSAALAAWLALSFPAALRAHQDPLGDVHPSVVVEGGNFAVYFENNLVSREKAPALYRMLFSPAGELLAPRHRAPAALPLRAMEQTVEYRGTRFAFPPWSRLHNGRPYYVAEPADGRPQRHSLPWPNDTVDEVVSACVDEAHITLAVTHLRDQRLYLYQFERNGFQAPKSIRLGEPTHIYSFPGCSRLVPYHDSFLIAWADPAQAGTRMVLDRWTPATGRLQHEIVSPDADWNTKISVGVIGPRVLIAYHYQPGGRVDKIDKAEPGGSRIRTIFRTLE